MSGCGAARLSGNFWLSLVAAPLLVGAPRPRASNGCSCARSTGAASTTRCSSPSASAYVMVETRAHRLRQDRAALRHARRCCRAPSTSASATSRSTACSSWRRTAVVLVRALAVPREDDLRPRHPGRRARPADRAACSASMSRRSGCVVFGLGCAIAGARRPARRAAAGRHARNGAPDPGRGLRGHGRRRHGLARGRRHRRACSSASSSA